MSDKKLTKLDRHESEYFLGRHRIEILKGIILKTIKRARQRARWDKGDDDEYFAEEIARDLYNAWNHRNKEEIICNYCDKKSIAMVRVEGKMIDVCRKHRTEYRKQQLKKL